MMMMMIAGLNRCLSSIHVNKYVDELKTIILGLFPSQCTCESESRWQSLLSFVQPIVFVLLLLVSIAVFKVCPPSLWLYSACSEVRVTRCRLAVGMETYTFNTAQTVASDLYVSMVIHGDRFADMESVRGISLLRSRGSTTLMF